MALLNRSLKWSRNGLVSESVVERNCDNLLIVSLLFDRGKSTIATVQLFARMDDGRELLLREWIRAAVPSVVASRLWAERKVFAWLEVRERNSDQLAFALEVSE